MFSIVLNIFLFTLATGFISNVNADLTTYNMTKLQLLPGLAARMYKTSLNSSADYSTRSTYIENGQYLTDGELVAQKAGVTELNIKRIKYKNNDVLGFYMDPDDDYIVVELRGYLRMPYTGQLTIGRYVNTISGCDGVNLYQSTTDYWVVKQSMFVNNTDDGSLCTHNSSLPWYSDDGEYMASVTSTNLNTGGSAFMNSAYFYEGIYYPFKVVILVGGDGLFTTASASIKNALGSHSFQLNEETLFYDPYENFETDDANYSKDFPLNCPSLNGEEFVDDIIIPPTSSVPDQCPVTSSSVASSSIISSVTSSSEPSSIDVTSSIKLTSIESSSTISSSAALSSIESNIITSSSEQSSSIESSGIESSAVISSNTESSSSYAENTEISSSTGSDSVFSSSDMPSSTQTGQVSTSSRFTAIITSSPTSESQSKIVVTSEVNTPESGSTISDYSKFQTISSLSSKIVSMITSSEKSIIFTSSSGPSMSSSTIIASHSTYIPLSPIVSPNTNSYFTESYTSSSQSLVVNHFSTKESEESSPPSSTHIHNSDRSSSSNKLLQDKPTTTKPVLTSPQLSLLRPSGTLNEISNSNQEVQATVSSWITITQTDCPLCSLQTASQTKQTVISSYILSNSRSTNKSESIPSSTDREDHYTLSTKSSIQTNKNDFGTTKTLHSSSEAGIIQKTSTVSAQTHHTTSILSVFHGKASSQSFPMVLIGLALVIDFL
ncbi:hypothetical protein, no similarity [Maudiozyma saulgeensis]|uniref:Hyphally-regulated cell wall protein N-terminal domain-containing protein n=1 Tax=Maudiozyma saulgeensis TaxID=1789683 RepID=A0A1X7RAF3_9SACH|nr:hypothetical protein, no similarity [Kazachstania saulgeensis]